MAMTGLQMALKLAGIDPEKVLADMMGQFGAPVEQIKQKVHDFDARLARVEIETHEILTILTAIKERLPDE